MLIYCGWAGFVIFKPVKITNPARAKYSLPVITIANLRRISADRTYCEVCAEELAEILFDLDKVRGTPRLYIPGHAVQR